ncbi:MAG: M23 family metallopeptidase [Myxococcota bacterium]
MQNAWVLSIALACGCAGTGAGTGPEPTPRSTPRNLEPDPPTDAALRDASINVRTVTTLGPPVEIRYPSRDPGEPRTLRPNQLLLEWPLPAIGITSLYGKRIDPVDRSVRFHRGIDIKADYGEIIRAPAAGQVVAAGWSGGYGRRLVIEHAGGYQTVYAHLAEFKVTLGSRVRAGQPLGTVGTSGRSTGAHLHLEVTHWNKPVDPLDVLGLVIDLP